MYAADSLADRARREAREAIVTLKMNGKFAMDLQTQDSEEVQASFNIYARPFVPRSLTIINSLPGHAIHTTPDKQIQYDAYTTSSFGPAAGFLHHPPLPTPPTVSAAALPASVGLRHYEAVFQQHLAQEAEAQRKEMEACALYGHQVDIDPSSHVPAAGYTVCSMHVPGLRENSPFVEEDDIVCLRQLVCEPGSTTALRGMAEWLTMKDVFENTHPYPWPTPAPGWTQIIYHARVLGVVRATETLHLKVAGLLGGGERTIKCNVQFEVPLQRSMVSSTMVGWIPVRG